MHRSRKKRLVSYAKILILISIVLLVYGFILDYGSPLKKSIDPIKEIKPIKEKENVVSITPSDGNEVVSDNNVSNIKEVDTNKPNTENKVVSLSETNNNLRNELQKKYSIKIKYGKETEGYSVKNGSSEMSTTPINDDSVINRVLSELNETLNLYPKGMFQEIKNGGIPLTIVLINNYSDSSVTGVTDSSYENAVISIAAIYPFAESFYHESYHYIERYMFKNGANFNSWDALNPSDFNWDTIDGKLSYSNTFSQDAYFVNNYAQTSAAEDRASTFEYMMANSKASCLNNGTAIWKKANYMAQMIRQVLSSVRNSSNVRWEKYLY